MNNEFLQTEEAIVAMLKTVYDPEIPVNVYDLGLIYKVDIDEEKNVRIDMTLTAPNCPAADFILEDVRMKVEAVDGVNNVEVNLVFEPEWDKDMMTVGWIASRKTLPPFGFWEIYSTIGTNTNTSCRKAMYVFWGNWPS